MRNAEAVRSSMGISIEARIAALFTRAEEDAARKFDVEAGLARFTRWMQGEDEPSPSAAASRDSGERTLVPVDVSELRGGPTVMRIVLGNRLRRIREISGVTAEQAARTIRTTASRLSRMEHGRALFRYEDVIDLLALYRITDRRERDLLCYLTTQSMARAWWHSYSDVLPGWFENYVGFEEAAAHIKTYHAQHIPGLLQTEAYAEAIARRCRPDAADAAVERKVAMIKARQTPLSGQRPPRLLALIDEAVLHRQVADYEVMQDQVQHLIRVSQWPNVEIRIVPLDKGVSSVVPCSFSIIGSAVPGLRDVIYLEHLTSAVYLEDEVEVAEYRAAMDRLAAEARPASLTTEILLSHLGEPPVRIPDRVRLARFSGEAVGRLP